MHPLLMRLLGRKPNTLPPFNFARNRYKTKKQWPPAMMQLPHRQQFLYERRFKRRLRLKSIRPTWNKWTKIVQWTIIGGFSVYVAWFYDYRDDPWNPNPGEQPLQEFRDWTNEWLRGLWYGDWEPLREGKAKRAEVWGQMPFAPGYSEVKKAKQPEDSPKPGPT